MRMLVSPRAATGDGITGLTIDRTGAITLKGRKNPELLGMLRSKIDRKLAMTVEKVNGYTQLIAPRTCPALPVKSITIESLSTVTATWILIGSGLMPSLSR